MRARCAKSSTAGPRRLPSPFSHAVAGLAIATPFRLRPTPTRYWWFAALCAASPDVDYLWNPYGMEWQNIWSHRGITHSLFYAVTLAAAVTWLGFAGSYWRGFRARIWLALTLAIASHGMLDSLTQNAGGVAFFAPFSNARFAFAWRPLMGPPDSIDSMAGKIAWLAGAEFVCIWIPSLILMFGLLRRRRG